jgi:hypothetical protein
LKVRAFNTSASSYAEAENSALKGRGNGTKPYFSVPKAARAIHEGTQSRTIRRQQKSAHNLNATRKNKPAYFADIADLVDYIQNIISADFKNAAVYEVFRPTATEFWVKKSRLWQKNDAIPNFNHCDFQNYMIPRFERTRQVKAISIDGKCYLECSCGKFQRQASPCAHIYKILDRPPRSADVSVRWTKHWNMFLYQSNHNDLLEKLEDLCKNERPGPLFEDSGRWLVGMGKNECNYFAYSLPSNPPYLQKRNRWANSPFQRNASSSKNNGTMLDLAASGMVQELICLSQGQGGNEGLDGGFSGRDSNNSDDEYKNTSVANKDGNVNTSRKACYSENLPIYNEITKLALFDRKVAEFISGGMRELLEQTQSFVAKLAGGIDCSIGPAIGKEWRACRLKPSYSPSKSASKKRKRNPSITKIR